MLKYILPLILLNFNISIAQANFAKKHIIDGVVLYQDSKINSLFYYAPYGLKLVKNSEGKPDFKFVQMRYTGTRLTEDQGSYSFKSLLRFKVANHSPSASKIDSIKKYMKSKKIAVKKLKPLPIHNLKAVLIHTAEDTGIPKEYANGFFESNENTPANTYWTERDFILRLNNEEAQLFWISLQSNQPTISVNYTFLSKGIDNIERELSVSGSKEFTEDMKARFEQEKDSTNTMLSERVIVSGALSINLNIKKWSDLIKQIDINERIPPDYAALDVYCFDFNNDIRKDLYAKKLEIKATGVGGDEVLFKTIFKATTPDIYAKTIKFIYAVKLDKPYFYKITEIANNGKLEKLQWKKVKNWHQILDITSQSKNKLN